MGLILPSLGDMLISCSRDGTIRFWDFLSGLCVKVWSARTKGYVHDNGKDKFLGYNMHEGKESNVGSKDSKSQVIGGSSAPINVSAYTL